MKNEEFGFIFFNSKEILLEFDIVVEKNSKIAKISLSAIETEYEQST